MSKRKLTPSFKGLKPATSRSSSAARASSIKGGTRCEVLLRRELFARGLRYRLHAQQLPGRPDIIFAGPRVVVFCDGDFWHGRRLTDRLSKLGRGHNAGYWVAKIKRNVERDRTRSRELRAAGWHVLRFWETDILRDPAAIADQVVAAVAPRKPTRSTKRQR